MKFMFLIYDAPTERKEMLPEDWKALAEADVQYRRELPEKGAQLLGNHVLELPKDATTLVFGKGEVSRANGPAVDTKEWLVGCYLVECDDTEAAVRVANQVPMPDGCGRVEVRPVMEGPA